MWTFDFITFLLIWTCHYYKSLEYLSFSVALSSIHEITINQKNNSIICNAKWSFQFEKYDFHDFTVMLANLDYRLFRMADMKQFGNKLSQNFHNLIMQISFILHCVNLVKTEMIIHTVLINWDISHIESFAIPFPYLLIILYDLMM